MKYTERFEFYICYPHTRILLNIGKHNNCRQSADYMPETQLQNVLIKEFGPNWQSDNFKEFNMKPFAAASIGQVHLAVLKDGR